MEFNQLMITSDDALTVEQRNFYNLHAQIVHHGEQAAVSLCWLAKNLSEMKNTELYREAGFDSLEDYSEKALNLGRRQAYNYAKIYEDLGESFVHSNAQLGVSKLVILSSIPEEERAEIESKTDLENISVSELNKLKKQLTQKDQKIEELDSEMNKYLEDDKTARDTATAEINRLQAELDNTENSNSEQLQELQTEIAELKAKEQDTPPTAEILEKIVEIEKIVEVEKVITDTAEIWRETKKGTRRKAR